MRVLMVHNRYRSDAPSGENRVVDEESALLREGGHEVELFQVTSDAIADFGPVRRALLPAQLVWAPGPRRDLRQTIARFAPDVVHVHNTFPLLSASVVGAARAAGVPLVVLPHGRDQADNAVRVSERGAGVTLERDAGPAAIASAVRTVLDDPGYREAAGRLGAAIRRDAAGSTLVDELEAVTGGFSGGGRSSAPGRSSHTPHASIVPASQVVRQRCSASSTVRAARRRGLSGRSQ